jgi:hypothetical protein
MEELTEDELSKINWFGALGYDPQRMFMILNWEPEKMEKHLNNETGQFHETYLKGSVLFEFKVDAALAQMAQNGDIKAIEYLDKRKAKRADL